MKYCKCIPEKAFCVECLNAFLASHPDRMNHAKMVAIVREAQLQRQLTDEQRPSESIIIRGIKRHRKEEDRGIGDTLERLIAKFGGRKFKAILTRLSINCGCDGRQQKLNEMYPYD